MTRYISAAASTFRVGRSYSRDFGCAGGGTKSLQDYALVAVRLYGFEGACTVL